MDAMKEMVVKEFLDDDSKISGVLAFQVKTQLKEQGYTVGDKVGEKAPTFKQIGDHFDKKGKSEKSDSTK
jgi:hypothetical protein